eukprot:1011113-Amphidinium_carterae.1
MDPKANESATCLKILHASVHKRVRPSSVNSTLAANNCLLPITDTRIPIVQPICSQPFPSQARQLLVKTVRGFVCLHSNVWHAFSSEDTGAIEEAKCNGNVLIACLDRTEPNFEH